MTLQEDCVFFRLPCPCLSDALAECPETCPEYRPRLDLEEAMVGVFEDLIGYRE